MSWFNWKVKKRYVLWVEVLAVHVPQWPHWVLPWSPVWLAPQLGPPAAGAAKDSRTNTVMRFFFTKRRWTEKPRWVNSGYKRHDLKLRVAHTDLLREEGNDLCTDGVQPLGDLSLTRKQRQRDLIVIRIITIMFQTKQCRSVIFSKPK